MISCMKKYKLLILDLDGTTVEPRGEALPSPKVIEKVRQAQKVIHVAVATGRPYPFAKPVLDALQLHGLGVVNGGSEIVDMESGKVEYAKKIDKNTLQDIVRLCLPFGYHMHLSSDQYGRALASPEDIKADAEKFFIGEVKTSDSPRILEELKGLEGIAAHPTKSWGEGDVVDIHITHAQATKHFGVERLIRMLGLTKEETIAIGDDYNDVPLMVAAGFRVAMGDAPEEVKAIADMVTETLQNDGVASAIDKLILA